MTANVTVFRVGVILIEGNESPYDLKRSGAAVTLAFDKVNEDVLNNSYRIVPIMRSYGPMCDANKAPGRSGSSLPIVRPRGFLCGANEVSVKSPSTVLIMRK